MRYIDLMVTLSRSIKCVVAAISIAVSIGVVGFAPAQADEAVLDRLFAELQGTDAANSEAIEAQIFAEWSKSGSSAVDLLLQRGKDSLEAADYMTAAEHFTAAIDHAPDFAESYNGRAAAYYFLGRLGPALDDLRQVLVLNPRHFAALRGFAVILEELDRPADALEVYKRVLVLHPSAPDVLDAIDRLSLQLNGQAL